MKYGISCLLVSAMLSGSALAGPFDGVFASNNDGCTWLKQEGSSALFNHDFLAMSLTDGIQANEFHCEFLDQKATGDGSALVITAFCEYPGEPYPDLISLREFGENSITLTSLRKSTEDAAYGTEGMWGSQIYVRCDELKELPR